MKVVAFIQARVSSSRFPGKVLAELGGKPMIQYMVERACRARLVDQVVVVTSEDPSDDALADALANSDVPLFRGSLDDVLGRFAGAAALYQPDIIVRLTGDCPLIDPALIDDVVRTLIESGADYASNVDPPTYPDGMDVEAFRAAALAEAHRVATAAAEREHVTVYMRRSDVALKRAVTGGVVDGSHLRLTVDYPDDLEVVRFVVAALGDNPSFDIYDIYRCLEANRAVTLVNAHARNEGLAKSLAAEGMGPAA